MPLEIERKFLVVPFEWESLAKPEPVSIQQGYITADDRVSVRVRLQANQAFLNIKKDIDSVGRYEYDYEIPFQEAEEILEKICTIKLEKWRYKIEVGDHLWEVDVFFGRNSGLVVAEVELQDREEVFTKPNWVGIEVTHDSRYLNTSLAAHPFDSWQV